jgi:3-deoxy-D-manno-octulosonic-acid transferase
LKTKGIYLLYRILQAFGLPILILYFLCRGVRNRGYWRSLPQRFGFLPRSFKQTGPGAIWLHAVSVGEILASVELLRRLRAQFPSSRLFVSTTTLAGHAAAQSKLQGLADGIFYAPIDYVFAVRRVLRKLKPSVVAVMETEIWPNLFRETKRSSVALAVVNGRISDRAFPRYRLLRWFFAAVLPHVDTILAQSEVSGQRFLALGAPPAKVHVGGNLKYDVEARAAEPGSPVMELIKRTGAGPVWIAASTMPPADAGDVDEDDAVLAAFQKLGSLHPGLLLILAPRKPDRFESAARKLEQASVPFLRRTALYAQSPKPPFVLLLDTIGELGSLFAAADAVFMGGSLARRGGHNVLEPALFAKPIVTGPHMENFQAIDEQFRAAKAVVQIANAAELAGAVHGLLQDPKGARQIGRRALACAEARRGATAAAVQEIARLHRTHIPCYRPAMPWYALAWLLSRIWLAGAARRQAAALRRQRRLNVPVISIGNLTMGGTGKTPCVLRLAELAAGRGWRTGILTRGYGRGTLEKNLVLPPGAAVGPEYSGDEPQIFIRSGIAAVGIGADRFATGSLLLKEFGVNLLLLDDGFQHRTLARSVDIVLLDALNPLGGGLFPIGRLREPAAALGRADIILITRSQFSDLGPAIEHLAAQWNPNAPVFYARVTPRAWVEHQTGRRFRPDHPPFNRAGGFCGLGNPESFRRTLLHLGVELVEWIEFPDHHRYRVDELRRIASLMQAKGASVMLTTEKDAINLCDACHEVCAPLPIYWLEISMEMEREEELMREIEKRIGPPPAC